VYFSRGDALPSVMDVPTYLAKMGSSSIVMSLKFFTSHPFSPVCLFLVAYSKIQGVLLFLLYKTLFILNSTCQLNNDINNNEKTLDLLHSLIWRLAAFNGE